MHMNLPKMKKDIYWDDSAARPPYTLAAADYCIPSFLGSTIEMGYVTLQITAIVLDHQSWFLIRFISIELLMEYLCKDQSFRHINSA